jgi:hypothetical protein
VDGRGTCIALRMAMRNCCRAVMSWGDIVEMRYQRVQYEGPHRRNARHMASFEVARFSLPI